MTVETAIESFVRGFAATRSFVYPYVASWTGGVWLLCDHPRRQDERTAEVVAYRVGADAVLNVARSYGGRWALCAISDFGDEQRTIHHFKQAGLRLRASEPLFVAPTSVWEAPIPTRCPTPTTVRRVQTRSDAEAVKVAAGRRQILPHHLGEDDSPCRLYAAFADGRAVGWVRSVRTHDDVAWVSNLYVSVKWRRNGLGRALMAAMMSDDARLGIRESVLLASRAGALLYPQLGYARIGTLQLMSPRA